MGTVRIDAVLYTILVGTTGATARTIGATGGTTRDPAAVPQNG